MESIEHELSDRLAAWSSTCSTIENAMQQTNGASGLLTALDSNNIDQAASAPHLEYSRRLKAREVETRQLNRQHIWVGNARLIVFAVILVLCWKTGRTGVPSVYWLIGAVLLFIGLGLWDRRIVRARNRAKRAANFYRRGLARMEDQWSGSGANGQEFHTP